MMSLEDITLYPFIMSLREPAKTNGDVARIYNFLVKYKVTDYKRLEDLITRGHPMVDTKDFNKMLLKASVCIDTINSYRREENNVSLERRPDTPYKNTLLATDKTTKLRDIIIANPMKPNKKIVENCGNYMVGTAKYLIRKIDTNGNNALATMVPAIGNQKVFDIKRMLDLYEEQINRVAKCVSPNFDGNLFYKDKAEKEMAILGEIHEIIDYLMHNGDNYIFGNITDSMIDVLARIGELPASTPYGARDRLVNILANNVTLEEAEQGLVRTRAIDRFIIK